MGVKLSPSDKYALAAYVILCIVTVIVIAAKIR